MKLQTMVRMNENARFEITQQGNVSFCNMTIDGQKSSITGTMAMFTVMGSLFLNNVTVQNCSTQGSGAVAWIEPSGVLNATNAIFSDNTAQQAEHIYTSGTKTA